MTPPDKQESPIYCHACSVAGGSEMPIYHLPPACGVDLMADLKGKLSTASPYDASGNPTKELPGE